MKLLPPLALSLTLLVAGCGGSAEVDDGRTDVVVAAYPLEYLAERVGGERARVHNVATRGVEPHDLELSPRDVAAVQAADLVVTLPGFQPALDTALDAGKVATYDISDDVDLLPGPRTEDAHGAEPPTGDGHGTEEEAQPHGLPRTPGNPGAVVAPAADDGHGEEPADESADEQNSSGEDLPNYDPHFWLDPLRMAEAAEGLADKLARVDPEGAETYRANAAKLREELEALDAEYVRVLKRCRSQDLVTAHDAFGYLAARYGLRQRPIAGISPQMEPSPASLAEVTKYVRQNKVTTVYAEVLTDPRIARTVTEETGAKLAVLDPIEGLPPSSSDVDYADLMRRNLAVLRQGQGCA